MGERKNFNKLTQSGKASLMKLCIFGSNLPLPHSHCGRHLQEEERRERREQRAMECNAMAAAGG